MKSFHYFSGCFRLSEPKQRYDEQEVKVSLPTMMMMVMLKDPVTRRRSTHGQCRVDQFSRETQQCEAAVAGASYILTHGLLATTQK